MKIMLDEGAKMPTRAHPYDAGLDLYAPEGDGSYCINACGGSCTIDTGVHVQIPEGCVGLVKSKSGLNVKHGLTCTGVIDSHYTGSITVKLYNHHFLPENYCLICYFEDNLVLEQPQMFGG